MNQFLQTHPTAEVAGAEYLAKTMAKWPAFTQQRRPVPATRSTPTAVVAGIEYRANSSGQRRPGLLTWPDAT